MTFFTVKIILTKLSFYIWQKSVQTQLLTKHPIWYEFTQVTLDSDYF
jgi:uncharacterized membrane protein YhfC